LGAGRGPVQPGEVSATLPGGERVAVVAVEEGSARLVVVVDRRVVGLRSAGSGAAPHRPPRAGADEVLLVDPRPRRFMRAGAESKLFTAARCAHVAVSDLATVLRPELEGPAAPAGQMLSDAVASAGLLAASGGRRRAVLLVLGAGEHGAGDLEAGGVRAFLHQLGVPLYVWSPVAAVVVHGSADWGVAADISSRADIDRASERLEDALRRQRIVWVEGLHLPQEVVLSSSRLVPLA
jgi:hypothetical protein